MSNTMSGATRLIASACIGALALGACGSSYKGLTKADFVKQAEAICVAGDAKLAKVGTSIGSNPSNRQVKAADSDQIVPELRYEVTRLKALKPPKADRDQVSKIFGDLSTGVDQASTAIKGLKSTADLTALAEPPALKSANAEAKAYGLTKCTDGSS
jgi:hypothetical protein